MQAEVACCLLLGGGPVGGLEADEGLQVGLVLGGEDGGGGGAGDGDCEEALRRG